MSLTAVVVATALALGSVAGSGEAEASAVSPTLSAHDAATHVVPAGKHHADGCGRKAAGLQGWCLDHHSGTYLPVAGGYASAPSGQAVSPVVGGYSSAPSGQALSPVVGGYVSTPAGEPVIPVVGQ